MSPFDWPPKPGPEPSDWWPLIVVGLVVFVGLVWLAFGEAWD